VDGLLLLLLGNEAYKGKRQGCQDFRHHYGVGEVSSRCKYSDTRGRIIREGINTIEPGHSFAGAVNSEKIVVAQELKRKAQLKGSRGPLFLDYRSRVG